MGVQVRYFDKFINLEGGGVDINSRKRLERKFLLGE